MNNDPSGKSRVMDFTCGFLAFLLLVMMPCQLRADPVAATEGGSLHLAARQDFPPVRLRGCGAVSGSLLASDTASILTIRCESAGKAAVLQAKYLSDLGLLPGVTPRLIPTARGGIAARQVNGQGVIAALRAGSTVFLLAAADTGGITALAGENLPPAVKIDASDATEQAAGVPMYLDRWDRYGMRFYYRPFSSPKSGDDFQSAYDPMEDFHFAKQAGDCGLVLWQEPFPNEPAEGIMKTPQSIWVAEQAEKVGLPLGIEISMSTPPPCSLLNRYREQWAMHQRQYLGGYANMLSNDEGLFSWNSVTGRDAEYALLQQTVRRFAGLNNVVSWLNPDEEMGHDACDNLIDFGPTADAGYREFLQSRYGAIATVSNRWFADATTLHSWDDVHVPELASFLGWGKDAVDLTGTWKVSHDAPAGSDTAAPAYDDSAWPSMPAPGHAIALLLPHTPAVLRRHIDIDPAWRKAHARVWLYVFDFSNTGGPTLTTRSFLNGAELTEAPPAAPHTQVHWAAYDVSSTLNTGDNTVAVDVPQGFFNYRVYFSPHPPAGYPDLGPQLNAQWADFIDWNSWSRAKAVRRGSQMIRQADPDRPITFMSPDSYAADIKTVCEDYGGVFHNTGYMGGAWADFHPMEMESANLPTDVEPGDCARSLADFKTYMGNWSTEGIQGVDYFQHLGDLEWKPDIRNYFHETINLWHLMGKYHVPKAQVALLSSDRVVRLYGFPFHRVLSGDYRHGHWDTRVNDWLLPEYAREEIFEQDFDRGNADVYKVIVDLNTSVMDDDFVAKIEKWVRAGGIFIAWGQTGRHTSVEKDAWPISRLTGFKSEDPTVPGRKLHVADGQQILQHNAFWTATSFQGMTLTGQAPECTDLVQWNDGRTAIGMRPLGKGFVIQTGVQVGPQFASAEVLALFEDIFDWAKIPRIPATAPGVLMRHYLSNNGLYDIWAMFNNTKAPVKTALTFRNGLNPKSALDVKTGNPVTVQQGAAGPAIPISLDTSETQALLTPRNQITSAPANWFSLQRQWWRGTADPGPALTPFKPKFTVDLQPDWSFKILDGPADGTQGLELANPNLDDSRWERRPFGIFTFPDHHDTRHAIFRKHFTVPPDWTAGRITLWLSEWHGVSYINNGRAFLDGQPLSSQSIMGQDLTAALKPGTIHTLAVEIWGASAVVGSPASVWLAYQPAALQQQNLAGTWTAAADGLTYTGPVAIPGSYIGPALRQTVTIDSAHAGQTAVIRVSAKDNSIFGVIVNGTWIPRFHHHLGNDFDIAITPYVKPGSANEIILFGSNGTHLLNDVSLDYYAKGTYP